MELSTDAVLAELGIPQWRARSGVEFPGTPEGLVTPLSGAEAQNTVVVPHEVAPEAPPAQVASAVDIYLCADVGSSQEDELLESILNAVRQLSPGIRVERFPLDAQAGATVRQIRLDDIALPSLAAMLHDPSLKRPVWAALKEAVTSLT